MKNRQTRTQIIKQRKTKPKCPSSLYQSHILTVFLILLRSIETPPIQINMNY